MEVFDHLEWEREKELQEQFECYFCGDQTDSKFCSGECKTAYFND